MSEMIWEVAVAGCKVAPDVTNPYQNGMSIPNDVGEDKPTVSLKPTIHSKALAEYTVKIPLAAALSLSFVAVSFRMCVNYT